MSRRFRLGVVLRLREMAEDDARAALGQALRDHAEALDAVRRLENEMAVERNQLAELQRSAEARGRAVVAGDFLDAVDAIATAERSLETGRDRLQAAAAGLFEARRVLAEASRRREVVERLRDRFVAAERLTAERREAAVLSELALTRHAWRALEDTAR